MEKKVEKLIPNNISETGMIDEDSGLRLYRGIMSPWDRFKSFRQACHFLWRHSALFGVAYMNALKIIEPDYEKRQTTMSTAWGEQMKWLWSPEDPMGAVKDFESRFDIPPFLKESMYRSGCYADNGDEFTGMPGYVVYASTDRVEKEIHQCPIDIIGPDACDLSVGGGQHFCHGCSGKGKEGMNVYLEERKGCGDPYCHTIHESVEKYGKHVNADGFDWECWGPSVSGIRKEGQPHKQECEWMYSGEFVSPLGARWTAGEMYKMSATAPLAYAGHAAGAIRVLAPNGDQKLAQHIVDVMFETAGKFQFGEYNTRKAAREWLGVPADVNDGRVLGGYISMIMQARSVPWSFVEFTPERTIVEVDAFTQNYFGQYPEFNNAYRAYFDGMAKTLVDTQWVVKLAEDAPEGKVRYVIEKGLYGYRRQKPGYHFEDNN